MQGPPQSRRVPRSAGSVRRRALVLGSNPKAVEQLLQDVPGNWSVRIVHDGQHLVREVTKDPFDAVVVDLKAPGSGWHLVRAVAELWPTLRWAVQAPRLAAESGTNDPETTTTARRVLRIGTLTVWRQGLCPSEPVASAPKQAAGCVSPAGQTQSRPGAGGMASGK